MLLYLCDCVYKGAAICLPEYAASGAAGYLQYVYYIVNLLYCVCATVCTQGLLYACPDMQHLEPLVIYNMYITL